MDIEIVSMGSVKVLPESGPVPLLGESADMPYDWLLCLSGSQCLAAFRSLTIDSGLVSRGLVVAWAGVFEQDSDAILENFKISEEWSELLPN